MVASSKGTVLVADQRSGPDRWSLFFLVVEESEDVLMLRELPKTIVSGDSSHGTERPVLPPETAAQSGVESQGLVRAQFRDDMGERVIVCDAAALVMYGGVRSWNEAGEVQREACPLRIWNGEDMPFDYYL